MTNQEAIKQLMEHNPYYPKAETMWEQIINKAIKALASTRWTPVSKGLPEETDTYIVTCIDKNTNKKWTDVAEYSKRHGGWRYGLHSSDDIDAWMPLPEPYGGEKNGDSD